MTFKNLITASISTSLICLACSSGGNDENPTEIDTVKPNISCPSNITVAIPATENTVIVTFETPVATDNISAVTSQSEGLPSGSQFPLGTTTNSFTAKDAAGNSATCSFNVIVTQSEPASNLPFFRGSNPTPTGKKWVKIENLSDEFNDDVFDSDKWQNTNPNRWIGREPGLFVENTMTEVDGNLRLTPYLLDPVQQIDGKTFTHAGSNIYSRNSAEVGSYLECRMKANQTFMSSTFWVINTSGEGTGCDRRTTELDIVECVGQVTTSANFAKNFDESMHSNTHSRNVSCPAETPEGSIGNNTPTPGKVWADYNVYAAWWKSPEEIDFFLNGEKVYTVNPKAPFSLPMHLRLVVETYTWNAPPADGGMTGSFEDRTTYYDWVRVWKLEDQ